jgi:hypothetical protein
VERGRWECDVEKATLETDVFGNVRREIYKKNERYDAWPF